MIHLITLLTACLISASAQGDSSAVERLWSFDWRARDAATAEREVRGFRTVCLPVLKASIRRPEGEFGAERRSGISYHKGIDFIAPANTPVLAAADGFICYNEMNGGRDSGYGYTVIIDHGNNFYTLYAHLKRKSPLPEGTWVSAGQRIARVGRSGNAMRVPKQFQYQLHFEIIHAPSGLMNLGGLKITQMICPQSLTLLREIGEAVYGPYWGGALNPEEFVRF